MFQIPQRKQYDSVSCFSALVVTFVSGEVFIMLARNAMTVRVFTHYVGWSATLIIEVSRVHGTNGKR